jgi:hypothetical protein
VEKLLRSGTMKNEILFQKMKTSGIINFPKLFGIIAFFTIIGLFITACGDETTVGGTGTLKVVNNHTSNITRVSQTGSSLIYNLDRLGYSRRSIPIILRLYW